MFVSVASTGSFVSSGQYFVGRSHINERVEWTATRNLLTDDPHKSLKVLAYTSLHADELKHAHGVKPTGRKARVPPGLVVTLSWHPKHNPDQREMKIAADGVLKRLGLQDHEALIVAHNDRPHKHLHILTSLVHPVTGIRNRLSFSKTKAQAWAREWERERNLEMEAPNRHKTDEDRRLVREGIREAWRNSERVVDFKAELKKHRLDLVRGEDSNDVSKVYVINEKRQFYSPTKALEIPNEEFVKRFEGYRMRVIPTKEQYLERKDKLNERDRTVDQSVDRRRTETPTGQIEAKSVGLDDAVKREISEQVNALFSRLQKEREGAEIGRDLGKTVSDKDVKQYLLSRDYDEICSLKRYELAQKHLDERLGLEERHRDRKQATIQRWEQNFDFKERKQELDDIKKKIVQKPGIMQWFSNKQTKLRNEYGMKRSIYELELDRYKKERRGLTGDHHKQMGELGDRQVKEIERFEQKALNGRPSWYVRELSNADLKERGMFNHVLKNEDRNMERVKRYSLQKAIEQREKKDHNEISGGRKL